MGVIRLASGVLVLDMIPANASHERRYRIAAVTPQRSISRPTSRFESHSSAELRPSQVNETSSTATPRMKAQMHLFMAPASQHLSSQNHVGLPPLRACARCVLHKFMQESATNRTPRSIF